MGPEWDSGGLDANRREWSCSVTSLTSILAREEKGDQGYRRSVRSTREWQTALIPLAERFWLLRDRVQSRSVAVRNELLRYLAERPHQALETCKAHEERSMLNEVIAQLVQWPTFHKGFAQLLNGMIQDPRESEPSQVAAVRHLLAWDSRLKEIQATRSIGLKTLSQERDCVWRMLWDLIDHHSEAVQEAALQGLQERAHDFGPDELQRFNVAILNIVNDPVSSPRIKAHALGIAQERSLKELTPTAEALVVDDDTSLLVRAASLGMLDPAEQGRVVDLLSKGRRSSH